MSVSVDKAVIARLTKGGEKFEILVDPDKALDFKGGKNIPLGEIVATPDVYHTQSKGEKVSPEVLNKTFGTNDVNKIAERIIREGEVQLTTEQRKKMLEDKTKRVASIISREGMNPQTKVPHPQERVLRAMEQARVRVQLERRAEEQVDTVLKQIQRIMPISIEKVNVLIKVPAQFAGNAVGIIHRFGKPGKENWLNDGSYSCSMELSPGIQVELMDKLSSMTHGQAEVKVEK